MKIQETIHEEVNICGLMLPQKNVNSIHIDFETNDKLYRFDLKPTDFLEWFDNESIKQIKDYINKKYCT